MIILNIVFLWIILNIVELNRVFVDDEDVQGVKGGKAYVTYGVSPEGAVVVVRPDGYVGLVVPLENTKEIADYFAAFLTKV